MLLHLVKEFVIDAGYASLDFHFFLLAICDLLLYFPQLSELSDHLKLVEYLLW